MAYIVKTNKGYIKRTSQFGPFHGNIVLTQDRDDALRFSKAGDAAARAIVAEWRTRAARPEHTGWDAHEGRDFKKFDGPLTAKAEEY